MYEIWFKLGPRHKDDEWLIGRIATIITGEDTFFVKESGYRWVLDPGNNWFMDRDSITGEFILAYRYSGSHNKEQMDALRVTILWLLGLGKYNKPQS